MKRIGLALLLAAALGAPSAFAQGGAPDPGSHHGGSEPDHGGSGQSGTHDQTDHGKASDHLTGCHGESAVFKGSVVAVNAQAGTLQLNVTHGNGHGGQTAGQNVTFAVGTTTEIRRNGPAKLTDLLVGDRAEIHVRACKDAVSGQPALLAAKVDAHPQHGASETEAHGTHP